MFNYECFTITTRVPLVVNMSVQRLDIDGAPGILRWIMPLFEHIDDSDFSFM